MEKKVSKDFLVFITTLTVLCAACFLVIAGLVINEYEFKIDSFNNFVAENRVDGWVKFFKIFTHIGSFYTLAVLTLIAVAILFFVFKKKRFAAFSAVCFGCVCIANFVIKILFKRARPEKFMLIAESGFSFPSGHAMMTFAFFALAIYFVIKFMKNKPLKAVLISLFSILIFAISFSRIYLGVHYLTDIIAGWLITFVIIVSFVALYNSKIFKFLKDDKR